MANRLDNLKVFPIRACGAYHGWKEDIKTRKHGFKSLKECGFTLAPFLRPDDLDECHKYGLQAFVIDSPDSWHHYREEKPFPQDFNIEDRVKALVERTRKHPATFGYMVMDEPKSTSFPNLRQVSDLVHEYAPDKICYINLYPNYGLPETQLKIDNYELYLESFVETVRPDMISYDNYRVIYALNGQNDEFMLSYYTNLIQVHQCATKYKLPIWSILCSNQIRIWSGPPSVNSLLLQLYSSLAAGAKGISWFTYYRGVYHYAAIDDSHDYKTVLWYYLKEVNRQAALVGKKMLSLESTGIYFLGLNYLKGPSLPGKLVQSAASDSPFMIGEFVDNKGRGYFLAVNLNSAHPAKVQFTLTEKAELEELCAGDGKWVAVEKPENIWITAGTGILYRFKTSKKHRSIEV